MSLVTVNVSLSTVGDTPRTLGVTVMTDCAPGQPSRSREQK